MKAGLERKRGHRNSDPSISRKLGCGQYPDIKIRGRAQIYPHDVAQHGSGAGNKVRFVTMTQSGTRALCTICRFDCFVA